MKRNGDVKYLLVLSQICQQQIHWYQIRGDESAQRYVEVDWSNKTHSFEKKNAQWREKESIGIDCTTMIFARDSFFLFALPNAAHRQHDQQQQTDCRRRARERISSFFFHWYKSCWRQLFSSSSSPSAARQMMSWRNDTRVILFSLSHRVGQRRTKKKQKNLRLVDRDYWLELIHCQGNTSSSRHAVCARRRWPRNALALCHLRTERCSTYFEDSTLCEGRERPVANRNAEVWKILLHAWCNSKRKNVDRRRKSTNERTNLRINNGIGHFTIRLNTMQSCIKCRTCFGQREPLKEEVIDHLRDGNCCRACRTHWWWSEGKIQKDDMKNI